MTAGNLPRFEQPPVRETVLGVQFKPVPGLHGGILGAYWKSLGEEWSKVTDAPPLEPQSEIFGKAKELSGLVRLSVRPGSGAARLQIRNCAEDRMIQVQNGRFHYNWLGQSGRPYPSYECLWQEFERDFTRFCELLAAERIAPIQPNLWEVTYVNHIEKGSVWNTPADWGSVLRLPIPLGQPAGAVMETGSAEWRFVIPPEKGRLYVQVQHGELDDGSEKLLLTLTARGGMKEGDDLKQMLEIGHRTIVLGFKDLTSDSSHRQWGLIHG